MPDLFVGSLVFVFSTKCLKGVDFAACGRPLRRVVIVAWRGVILSRVSLEWGRCVAML